MQIQLEDRYQNQVFLIYLDDSVMKTLEASNFKEYIVHKTGHGLGMDVHEDPYVMRKIMNY